MQSTVGEPAKLHVADEFLQGAAARRARRPRSEAITTAPLDDHWAAVAGAPFSHSGTTRTHYIQAEEVVWDYAPQGSNVITGEPFGPDENVFVKDFLGSNYTKCLYHGYTDDTFSERLERAPEDAYLGMLGPVLRAAVGDRVDIVFRNRCSFRNSVHLHGLFYGKGSEGAPHDDGSVMRDMQDDMVAPGGSHTYRCAPACTARACIWCTQQGSAWGSGAGYVWAVWPWLRVGCLAMLCAAATQIGGT